MLKIEDSAREITLEDALKFILKTLIKSRWKSIWRITTNRFWPYSSPKCKTSYKRRVREAEKNRQYEDFIDKQGQILSGIIKRLEYGNVIVDLGKAEGVIKKDELIPREILKTGDRVKAYCYEVRKS